MVDLIFWYTGAILWAWIAGAVALIFLVLFVVGAGWTYRRGHRWVAIAAIRRAGMTPDEAVDVVEAMNHLGPPRGATSSATNQWISDLGLMLKGRQ